MTMRQKIFIVLFFCGILPDLPSQTAGQERRVHIPWIEVDHTDHYEVVIEKGKK